MGITHIGFGTVLPLMLEALAAAASARAFSTVVWELTRTTLPAALHHAKREFFNADAANGILWHRHRCPSLFLRTCVAAAAWCCPTLVAVHFCNV